ncbi:ImuA family protein [Paenirhodobacter enshiensis]|uniref:ImuA family protein n=1 Tax=Paenirhodobacter enshiensis TaxID=1105367 RepID=UPI003FA23D19
MLCARAAPWYRVGMDCPNAPLPLLSGRVHEVGGPSAVAFALIRARQAGSPLFWIRPAWLGDQPLPDGLARIVPPSAVIGVATATETDSLAAAEEALRDGAVPVVIVDITRPLSLREGRRLQLAAGAGRSTGLCLIAQGMGSNAAETRWHCAPLFDPESGDSTLMRWEITKNKKGTLGVWHVRWNRTAHRLDVVSPVRLGPGAPAEPGGGALRP